jgi:hypothetical protein
MFLTFNDLSQLFPISKGVKDCFRYEFVSTDATLAQPMGLFIPVFEDSGELKDAISNGAIGAIWEENKVLPSYIPSQFPIFFTDDLGKALDRLLSAYVNLLNGEPNEMNNMTKFLFSEEKILNEIIHSYDKPVLKFVSKTEGRE